MNRRRFLRTAGTAAAAASVAGCTGGSQSDDSETTDGESTAESATDGESATEGEGSDDEFPVTVTQGSIAWTLDPHNHRTTSTTNVLLHTYEGLLARDAEGRSSRSWRPSTSASKRVASASPSARASRSTTATTSRQRTSPTASTASWTTRSASRASSRTCCRASETRRVSPRSKGSSATTRTWRRAPTTPRRPNSWSRRAASRARRSNSTRPSDYLKDVEIAQAVAGQIDQLGSVSCSVEQRDFGALGSSISDGDKTTGPAFYLLGWGNPTFDASQTLIPNLTSDGALSSYENEEIDRLVEQAGAEADEDARERQLQKANRLLHDDAPRIFLHRQYSVYGASDHIDWEPRRDEKIDVSPMTPS